ncbi:hypothetical protein A2215_01990 [Candidatus Berkelbacteria bacterium RIFOXYA2_FULL_43_10]|uniref:Uncharacterized protein n=1 Tax=Candidatus Berkelbacteria bacterium RIFOXYA2_FULL_43_10 TaxID=1797472 RepID=A0A1F5E427_9BACT|nr:MAG: hypothetical protein A2215_01990 [Candidatus Berkelbacteria bacterium RIFOXYA2_FULL_43_10]
MKSTKRKNVSLSAASAVFLVLPIALMVLSLTDFVAPSWEIEQVYFGMMYSSPIIALILAIFAGRKERNAKTALLLILSIFEILYIGFGLFYVYFIFD